ncbi:MAG: methyltransferase domain-containing protein [Rhizobiales bacterium]|nr:methyltransferase domain-containing protein [Hyphomicrobiales bacterium]
MTDFAAARQFMVQGQVRVNDVTEPRLTSAMLELPRERFLPAALADLAYLDRDLPVTSRSSGPQRCLLKPLTLAKLIQAAAVESEDRVLDVGCATGYGTALLAHLAASVVALEEDADLARDAERNVDRLGFVNVTVVRGPLGDGWPVLGPYDVIVVEGRCEIAPHRLLSQLGEGGCLVCVQGRGPGAKGIAYRCVRGDVSGWPLFEATAPLLPGFAKPPAFVF